MDFLKNKLSDYQESEKNILLEKDQPNPYGTLVGAPERAFRAGSAMALSKPLRTQLQKDRELRMMATTRPKEVLVVSRHLSMLSPTPSRGRPVIGRVPLTVPSTTLLGVVISSPVPTLSAQSPPALLSRSPGALSLQMEGTEDDPFAN